MKPWILLGSLALALPAYGQASNDDTASTENWWDKVGAEFFGEANLDVPRPEPEIRAQWTALSADDQAAVRARCADGADGTPIAASQDEGDEDNAPDATEADLADTQAVEDETEGQEAAEGTTVTGSVEGAERQVPADGQPAPDTGLAGGAEDDATRMVLICDLIDEL